MNGPRRWIYSWNLPSHFHFAHLNPLNPLNSLFISLQGGCSLSFLSVSGGRAKREASGRCRQEFRLSAESLRRRSRHRGGEPDSSCGPYSVSRPDYASIRNFHDRLSPRLSHSIGAAPLRLPG